jgi:hypothetical protein
MPDIETFRQIVLPLVATIIVLGGGVFVAAYAIYLAHTRARQRDEMAGHLKMEMIERGMSADEVARVLHAELQIPKGDTASQHAKQF